MQWIMRAMMRFEGGSHYWTKKGHLSQRMDELDAGIQQVLWGTWATSPFSISHQQRDVLEIDRFASKRQKLIYIIKFYMVVRICWTSFTLFSFSYFHVVQFCLCKLNTKDGSQQLLTSTVLLASGLECHWEESIVRSLHTSQ